jgi:hypothetical protein
MRPVVGRWIVAGVTLLVLPLTAFGQDARGRGTGTALPRTPDGKPELSGYWQVMNTAAWDIRDHQARLGVPAGQGIVEGNEIPYQPWAAAKQRENFEKRESLDPELKCYLPGVPRITYMPYPFQIVQSPAQISILYEYIHTVRNIFMGTPHLRGPIEWWMGDSRGRWEGNTLVVDVVHFNDQTWFDRAGNFHSDALHLIERYTLTGPDHITYEVTVEDPKVFTRPWKMSTILYRRKEKDVRLLEYECYDYAYFEALKGK